MKHRVTDVDLLTLSISKYEILVLGDLLICLFVGRLTSQQHASVSQGRIRSDNCCHTETEVANQTVCLTLSQYTDPAMARLLTRQPLES